MWAATHMYSICMETNAISAYRGPGMRLDDPRKVKEHYLIHRMRTLLEEKHRP